MAIEIIRFNPLEESVSAVTYTEYLPKAPIYQTSKTSDRLGIFVVQLEKKNVCIYNTLLDFPSDFAVCFDDRAAKSNYPRIVQSYNRIAKLLPGKTFETEFVDDDDITKTMIVLNNPTLL